MPKRPHTRPLTLTLYGSRLLESGVLGWISRHRREEVTAEWEKLQIEELHDLYSSRCVFRVITSRWMKWAGHVARMGTKKFIVFRWRDLKERDDLQDLDLKQIRKKLWCIHP